MAQIYTKNQSKLNSVNIFRDGAWQNEKIGYVYYQGEWIPFINYRDYLFKDGIAIIPYEQRVNGYNWFTEYNGYLELRTRGTYSTMGYLRGIAGMRFNQVDITKYSNICIDYTATLEQSEPFYPSATFVLKTNPSNLRYSFSQSSSRIIVKTSIKDLIGLYDIFFDLSAYDESIANIYNIWLE
ncbi:hypothetical protein [Lentibacillus sp. Marseille-P4043]|uniref:hypothetical protein n=1 Tax=Lentibacillus sp. Marseille-P4043 TaxID=2040293 RepID=UPI000D0BB194|nr:hypothetical protein [Lentibacillus sp. Marseille-P4043]